MKEETLKEFLEKYPYLPIPEGIDKSDTHYIVRYQYKPDEGMLIEIGYKDDEWFEFPG